MKEILEQKDSENSQDNSVVIINDNSSSSFSAVASSNGIKTVSIDITDNAQPIPVLTSTSQFDQQQIQNISTTTTISTMITTTNVSSTSVISNNNNDLMEIQQQLGLQKKTGTGLTKLPLPPGTNVSDLVNVKTPSPPRSPITPMKIKFGAIPKLGVSAASSGKKGLLNLPMPPMVPGSEDVSGDENDDVSPRPSGGANGSRLTTPMKKSTKAIKRPIILNRRNSRSAVGPGPGGLDWGERSVDVFEVLVQIGEGTYGQVCFQ